MRAFLDEVTLHEREQLIERLRAASARLRSLVQPGVLSDGESKSDWSAHDVLAHIAVLSKFYGMLAYQVGSGKVTEVALLEHVQARDVAGEELSRRSDSELLSMIQADHQRTMTYLESAGAEALHRRAMLDPGFSMSALELALLGLCNHLEIHLEQLDRT